MDLDGRFFTDLVSDLAYGVFLTDCERKVVYWNRASEEITGFQSNEAIGRDACRDLMKLLDEDGVDVYDERCPVEMVLHDAKPRDFEARLVNKDGRQVPVILNVSPFRNEGGELAGVTGILRNSSYMAEARHRIEELEALSLIDPLTKLGNRLYMEMNIVSKLNELRRYGWPFGIFFMDVDNFKGINDKYGHDAGDRMLTAVAKALQSQTRPFDVLGRWGGDELCVLVVQVKHEQLYQIADRYRRAVENASFQEGSETINGTVSIGATLAMPDDSADTLYRRVDQLMYQSKSAGRNCVTVDPDQASESTA